jgi:hypothetical protein
MNREHYSMIRDMYSEKNPNRARRYGSRVQDLENKIEYYETLMDIYKEVAETVTNENYQMKREYIQEQTAIAKRRLTDKMRYGKKY